MMSRVFFILLVVLSLTIAGESSYVWAEGRDNEISEKLERIIDKLNRNNETIEKGLKQLEERIKLLESTHKETATHLNTNKDRQKDLSNNQRVMVERLKVLKSDGDIRDVTDLLHFF